MADNLSREEMVTLETYEKMADTRSQNIAGAAFDPNFWLSEFEKFRSFLPSGKVIDLGCGNGREALLFAKAGYHYVGIDLSEKMLKEARQLAPHAVFLKMNLCRLFFPDQYFSGFWATASLFHVPKETAPLVLQEVRRTMRTGAIGFIQLREGDGQKMIPGKDGERFFALYRAGEFRTILEDNGFEVLEFERRDKHANNPACKDVYLLYFVRVL